MVATDTMRLPDAVKKISAAFNARTFLPRRKIRPKRVELKRIGRFTVIGKKQLGEALQSSETFLEWLRRYKSRYHETKQEE